VHLRLWAACELEQPAFGLGIVSLRHPQAVRTRSHSVRRSDMQRTLGFKSSVEQIDASARVIFEPDSVLGNRTFAISIAEASAFDFGGAARFDAKYSAVASGPNEPEPDVNIEQLPLEFNRIVGSRSVEVVKVASFRRDPSATIFGSTDRRQRSAAQVEFHRSSAWHGFGRLLRRDLLNHGYADCGNRAQGEYPE
jgi:hypothetical protein